MKTAFIIRSVADSTKALSDPVTLTDDHALWWKFNSIEDLPKRLVSLGLNFYVHDDGTPLYVTNEAGPDIPIFEIAVVVI